MRRRTRDSTVAPVRRSAPGAGIRTGAAALAALLLPVLALAGLAGCSSPFEGGEETVEATGQDGVLTIRNLGEERVYYFVLERNQVAVVDWTPCTDPEDPEGCPRIEPGGQVQMDYEDVFGYDPGLEDPRARVYWWRLVDAGLARLTPDRVRWVEADLR